MTTHWESPTKTKPPKHRTAYGEFVEMRELGKWNDNALSRWPGRAHLLVDEEA